MIRFFLLKNLGCDKFHMCEFSPEDYWIFQYELQETVFEAFAL